MSVLDDVFKLYWCQVIAAPLLPMMRLKVSGNDNKIILVNYTEKAWFGLLLEPDGNFSSLRMPLHTQRTAWSHNLQESSHDFDIEDPSTVTGLRDLLREACGDPSIHAQPSIVDMSMERGGSVRSWTLSTAFESQFPIAARGRTEGEAYASGLRKRLQIIIDSAERKPLPWEV